MYYEGMVLTTNEISGNVISIIVYLKCVGFVDNINKMLFTLLNIEPQEYLSIIATPSTNID